MSAAGCRSVLLSNSRRPASNYRTSSSASLSGCSRKKLYIVIVIWSFWGSRGRAKPLALARDEQVIAEVRERAARSLGDLGRVEEAAPILLALARDEQVGAQVRQGAIWALGNLERGGVTPQVLSTLHMLAEDNSAPETVRRSAQWVWRRLEKKP